MEIKLANGTIFTIEAESNAISIRKTNSDVETTLICTRQGCSLKLDDNLFYVM